MIASATELSVTESPTWQQGFLTILPWIKRRAKAAFHNLDVEAREDAVAEVIASTMCAYQRLDERDELWRASAAALTRFAIAQYYQGRRVGSAQRSGDVYSRRGKQDSGGRLLHLESPGDREGEWREALVDNRRSPIPAQVAFRLDFPRWLAQLHPRDRLVAERLSLNCSTREVAQELQVSPGRISQLRHELAESWYAFVSSLPAPFRGDAPDEDQNATSR